ncbi:MAG: CBS domain-containing protein [Bdellovibrionota bacterium]
MPLCTTFGTPIALFRAHMNVADIMTADVEMTSPDETLCEAARRMKDSDIGMLPVCSHDRLVGVITDRDIVVHAAAHSLDLEITRVHEAMSSPVIYCYEDQAVEEAAGIMETKQIRRLLVLNREKDLVGVLSLGDLALDADDEMIALEVLESVSENTEDLAAA